MTRECIGREITRAKWCKGAGLLNDEIPADAVTVDLRTSNNKLSFWRCGTYEKVLLDDLALAMASAADRVDRMDFVWMQQDELEDKSVKFVGTKGLTPVEALVDKHVDALSLDFVRLGQIARSVDNALQSDRYRRFTKKEIAGVLMHAVQAGRVQLDELREKVQEEVAKQLAANTDQGQESSG